MMLHRQGSTLKALYHKEDEENTNGYCKEIRGILIYVDERDV